MSRGGCEGHADGDSRDDRPEGSLRAPAHYGGGGGRRVHQHREENGRGEGTSRWPRAGSGLLIRPRRGGAASRCGAAPHSGRRHREGRARGQEAQRGREEGGAAVVPHRHRHRPQQRQPEQHPVRRPRSPPQPQQGHRLARHQQCEEDARGHLRPARRVLGPDHQHRQQRLQDQPGRRHRLRHAVGPRGRRFHRRDRPARQYRPYLPAAFRCRTAVHRAARLPCPGAQESLSAAPAEPSAVCHGTGGRSRARDRDVGAGVAVPAQHPRTRTGGVPRDVGQRLTHDAVRRLRDGAVRQGVDLAVHPLVQAPEPGDQVPQTFLR